MSHNYCFFFLHFCLGRLNRKGLKQYPVHFVTQCVAGHRNPDQKIGHCSKPFNFKGFHMNTLYKKAELCQLEPEGSM